MEIVRMPLYFILSGLFFKPYGGTVNFTIKKANKILLPFLFFFLTGMVLDYVFSVITGAECISLYDSIFNRTMFNAPIWFLLALFWANILFAIICKILKSDLLRIIFIITLSILGYYLSQNEIAFPLYIDSTFAALPFFCFGYYLKQTPILYSHKYDKYNLVIAVILYAVTILLMKGDKISLSFLNNSIIGNPILVYTVGVISAISLILFCKVIKTVPVLSYIGKYSIIMLCVHWVIIKVAIRIPYGIGGNRWFVFLIVLLSSIAMIPFCKRYIPWFVAQRDLIKINK